MFKHTATPTFGPIQRSKLDLMGIRFLNEPGDGTGAGGGDAAAQAAAQAAAAAGNGAGAGDGAGGEQNAPWTKENFDPERAWRLTENLRHDLTEQKTKTEQAIAAAAKKAQEDTLAQFAKLLTGQGEPETDPAKLAAQIAEKDTALTAAQAAAKSGAISTAVAVLAPGLGASAKLLLSNEQFKTSIASVEPTDEAAITAAITKALQANAALKATPPRSGSGEHQGAAIQTLEAQLKTATEKKDWVETIRLKQAIAAARKA